MKFGDAFTKYLHGDQDWFLDKCSHVEYKRLKKVLKRCRGCRTEDDDNQDASDASFDVDSCPLCDQKFFSELTKEAVEIAGFFSSRVRRLLNMHFSSGLQRYIWRLRHCFTDDQHILIQEGIRLLDYVTMNATAIRKILKKYDKVHGSITGRKFRSKMHAEQLELLQSPWLIELGAFYINFSGSETGTPGAFFRKFSCDLSDNNPVMTLTLSGSIKYEYSLSCAVCLYLVFNPYALSCGHLFCKVCACSAASVLIIHGLKTAPRNAKCPVCRMAGVYRDAVHMTELDLLLKTRNKDYWKERLHEERSVMVKQAKDFWESQKMTAMGF